MHTFGWPIKSDTYGGGFIYHFGENLVSIGLVTGLGYSNPYPFAFRGNAALKTHPQIARCSKAANVWPMAPRAGRRRPAVPATSSTFPAAH
jgi:flavin-dependent dehydrogenase